jgi:hypothetical protein
MLLCLIAHLFAIKLRMEFDCKPPSSGPAPYIDGPVSLDDYLEAAESLMNNEEIEHPNITSAPDQPQQVLTIGLVRMLIVASFTKVGSLLENINYYLYTAAQAFDSHSRSTVNQAFVTRYGYVPNSGGRREWILFLHCIHL